VTDAHSTVRDEVVVLHEFAELVAASARSARQRERLIKAARVPLTDANLVALRTVERHGPIAASAVARRLDVDQSTASRQLRPLEEHGLIRRATDPDDRRVAWLTTTAKGRALLERVDEVVRNDFAVALDDWEPADRAALAALVDRLHRDLLRTRTDDTGWAVRKAPEE
jgi:DNA-binding MarR family transcriptional regulator